MGVKITKKKRNHFWTLTCSNMSECRASHGVLTKAAQYYRPPGTDGPASPEY